jgi:EmrB/QacA subfamily drug resistance transporter
MDSTRAARLGNKRLILVACILGSAVAFVDSTVVNVALPAIARDLGGGLAGQQWVANGYLLTLGSLILIGGSLGDIFGERRVFAIGVGGFGVTSILCAAAPSIEMLVVGRGLQGVFGALLVPATLAIIVANFPPNERGAAIGTWTAWSGISTVAGPLIGGQLVDSVSWRWIFAINVPIVLATFVLIAIAVPETGRRKEGVRVDVVGALLCALGLGGPVFALIEQPNFGWNDPIVYLPLILGLFIFAAFIAWERRTPMPMLPLGLFRIRNFAAGNLETFAMYAGLAILFFYLTLYLQQVAGYDALQAGLATLPTTVVLFLLSRRFGALADRYGPRFFMGVGPLVAALGQLLMLRVDRNLDYVTDLLPALVLFSLGLAMTVAPLTAAVLAGANESDAGIASGVNNAIARVAGLVGVSVVGVLISARFSSALDSDLADRGLRSVSPEVIQRAKDQPLGGVSLSGLPPRDRPGVSAAIDDASTTSFHLAMGGSAVLVALGGLLGLIGIQNPRRTVRAETCPGGSLAGAPREAAGCPEASAPAPAQPELAGAET